MVDVKIESNKCKEEESKYPYIGISTDGLDVVLFTKKKTGVVIYSNRKDHISPIGYLCDGWYEQYFIPFKGKITLSNG